MRTVRSGVSCPMYAGVSYPRVTGGARACPTEDVGGPYGYAEFLSIINNPKSVKTYSISSFVVWVVLF